MVLAYLNGRTGFTQDAIANARGAEDFDPSAGLVTGAGFGAGREGDGSGLANVDAALLNMELGRDVTFQQQVAAGIYGMFADIDQSPSPVLTEDAYKSSDYFREDLKYEEGMTERFAAIRSTRHDAERERQFIFEKTSGAGAGLYFGSALAGGIADVKNLLLGAGVGAVFSAAKAGYVGLSAATTAMRSATVASRVALSTVPTLGQRAAVVGAESIVSTVPSVVSGVQDAPVLGSQYTVGDAFLELAASTVISVGVSGAAGMAGKARKNIHVTDRQAAADLAVAQIASGERVNIDPIIRAAEAERVPQFSTIDPRVASPQVTKNADGTFSAQYKDDGGIMASVVVRADTPETATARLREVYEGDLSEAAAQVGISPQQLAALKQLRDTTLEAENFDIDQRAMELAKADKKMSAEINKLEARLAAAETKATKAETALEARPTSSSRQREVANAKAKVSQVRDQLTQALAPARGAAEAQRGQLARFAQDAKNSIREQQRAAAKQELDAFAREQLPDATPAPRTAAQDVEVAERTGLNDLQRAEQDLDAAINDLNAPPEVREQLARMKELEIDKPRLRAEALERWRSCLGGG